MHLSYCMKCRARVLPTATQTCPACGSPLGEALSEVDIAKWETEDRAAEQQTKATYATARRRKTTLVVAVVVLYAVLWTLTWTSARPLGALLRKIQWRSVVPCPFVVYAYSYSETYVPAMPGTPKGSYVNVEGRPMAVASRNTRTRLLIQTPWPRHRKDTEQTLDMLEGGMYEVSQLVGKLDAGEYEAVRHAMVWIVAANARYEDLQKESPSPMLGANRITADWMTEALIALEQRGVPVKDRRIWQDRRLLMANVTEPQLQDWLRKADQ